MGGGNRGNLQTENRWLCFLQKYVSSWPLNSHGLDGARCGATGDFPRRRGEVLHALPAECIPAARPAGRGASQAERMLMSGLEDRFARNIPGSFTPRTPQWHLQPLAFDRRGAPGKSACPRTDCILEGGAEREECSPRIAAIYFWETSEGPGLGCARLSRDCSGRPSPARGRRDSRRPPVLTCGQVFQSRAETNVAEDKASRGGMGVPTRFPRFQLCKLAPLGARVERIHAIERVQF
jgi:hypothetical protein